MQLKLASYRNNGGELISNNFFAVWDLRETTATINMNEGVSLEKGDETLHHWNSM